MPTGYTAPIYEGEEMTFEQFALRCARNFGALVSMREEPMDAPIPDEFKVDAHYQKDYEEAKAAYENFLQNPPTDEELEKSYARYVQKETDYAREANEKRASGRKRYEAMLAKVRQWEPPTPEHVNLKDFMIEQLTNSMNFDCRGEYMPRICGKQEHMEYERSGKFYEDNLRVSKERLEKAIQSCESRNAWLKDLRDSLRAFEKGEQA